MLTCPCHKQLLTQAFEGISAEAADALLLIFCKQCWWHSKPRLCPNTGNYAQKYEQCKFYRKKLGRMNHKNQITRPVARFYTKVGSQSFVRILKESKHNLHAFCQTVSCSWKNSIQIFNLSLELFTAEITV